MRAAHVFAAIALTLAACNNAPAGPPLTGTQWWLNTMPGYELGKAPQVPTIHFRTSTEAGGRAGCNTWGGTYKQSAGTIRFDPVYATEMACEYGMETEQLFLAALGKARRVNLSGETLTLADEAGAELASFTRASTAVPPQ
jgi:heat shock protein HslJ